MLTPLISEIKKLAGHNVLNTFKMIPAKFHSHSFSILSVKKSLPFPQSVIFFCVNFVENDVKSFAWAYL